MTASNQCTRRRLSCRANGRGAEVACDDCGLFGICLVAGLDEPDLDLLDRVIERRQVVARGDSLFRAEQPFEAVYAVKSGSFKTYVGAGADEAQVVGFHLPGELLGLDALKHGRYSTTAEALEAGSVCQLRFGDLERLGERFPQFQEQLIEAMSEQLLHGQRLAVLSGKQTAEERLAAFLCNLSERLAGRGLSGVEFRLAMSRQDIADYLGLAVETVSRTFKRFQARGWLSVSGKHLCLRGLSELEALSGGRSRPDRRGVSPPTPETAGG
jgi:CRP/FNR family transcriptional regulator